MLAAAGHFLWRPAVLAAMATLFAPPSAAFDPVELRAVTGPPEFSARAGQAIATRNVGVVVESDLIDADATVVSCAASRTPALPALGARPACAASAETVAAGFLGYQFGLTLKIPRWADDAPTIDVTLRSWNAPPDLASRNGQAASTTAGLVFTQPLGSMVATLGFTKSAQDAPSLAVG